MRLVLATLLFAAVAVPAGAQDTPRKPDQVRERINKAWDARLEKIRDMQIESKCKAESKKQYSAIHFRKRRAFVQDCIAEAHR